MTMVFNFVDDQNNHRSLHVGVDHVKNKVYFMDKSDTSLDYEELEEQIINFIRPEEIEIPEIPTDFLFKANQMRQGRYNNHSFYKTEENDVNQ